MTDDEELMARLRRIGAQVDPVPEVVMESARAALLTRRVDEELAELLLDSAADSAAVRGAATQVRLLSFQRADLSLEVQAEYDDERVTLRGLVDGPTGTIELDSGGEVTAIALDSDGGFSAELARGPVRFRLRTPDGRVVSTDWVLL